MTASSLADVTFLPIVHGALPFAVAVREAFFRDQPDCVAVEYPVTLTSSLQRAVARLPLLSLIRYHAADGPVLALVEPTDGVMEAVRLAIEHSVPWHAVDRDTEAYADFLDELPDPYAVERIGLDRYVSQVGPSLGNVVPSTEDEMREATMAWQLDRLRQHHRRILFVCGIAHAERIRTRLETVGARPLGRVKRDAVELLQLHPDSSREVLSEPPWIQVAWEAWRKEFPTSAPPWSQVDRYRLIRELLLAARKRLLDQDGDNIDLRAIRLSMQFARNQALLRGGLAPDLVEIVTAARGVHSDDFAWHVYDLATTYPYQAPASSDPPVYRVTLQELARRVRHIVFHRRLKTRRHLLRLIRSRGKDHQTPDWQSERLGEFTCSYPPEDIRIENFGSTLRKRAKGMIAGERARILPFTASLGDGIDVRETIRNMLKDARLYVREDNPIHGQIDSVVVIFDEQDKKKRYTFTMTWLGEHDQESDMALYSTPPTHKMVGPGIGRCEYGGFLMTYPPGRLINVFEDPYFNEAETHAERLALAAIDYAQSSWIVYVAARPPRARVTFRARQSGKRIMYIPIGQLAPQTLRRLRVFHILDHRQVRGYAKDYI